MRSRIVALLITLAAPAPIRGALAQASSPAWDSVAAILRTSSVNAGGYRRFNLPRRDLRVQIGDVTIAPALALGAWAGFSGEPSDATAMGDLIVTAEELPRVLSQLSQERVAVTAIHNHLVGESPRLVYVHFHGQGVATDLAGRLDRVVALTGTPRPVSGAGAAPLSIDTALVFRALGQSGRGQGSVAQVGLMLVPGPVTMDGRILTPSLGYGSPVNIQMVSAQRAVATGDFAVTGPQVPRLLTALATHGMTATALHSHLIDESPRIYFIHFWADGPLPQVLDGLKAVIDAAR
jgi:hypothetical protein